MTSKYDTVLIYKQMFTGGLLEFFLGNTYDYSRRLCGDGANWPLDFHLLCFVVLAHFGKTMSLEISAIEGQWLMHLPV